MAVPRAALPLWERREDVARRCEKNLAGRRDYWYWYFLLTSAGNWYLGNGFLYEVTALTLPSFQKSRGNLTDSQISDQIFARRGFYSKETPRHSSANVGAASRWRPFLLGTSRRDCRLPMASVASLSLRSRTALPDALLGRRERTVGVQVRIGYGGCRSRPIAESRAGAATAGAARAPRLAQCRREQWPTPRL